MRLRADRREERRREAGARNAAWALLTTAQKLASLDGRLGAGKGANRQRVKMSAAKAAAFLHLHAPAVTHVTLLEHAADLVLRKEHGSRP